MLTSDLLLQRNARFAERFQPDPTMMPALGAIIVTCADPRVDPAAVLGLQRGEALVIRNIGGRITPGVIEMIASLGAIAQAEGVDPGRAGLEIIVMQHTDCGITRLGHQPDLLAHSFGIGRDELPAKAIDDPHAAVAVDLETLRANPFLPAGVAMRGLVYDVHSGRADVVEAPTAVPAA